MSRVLVIGGAGFIGSHLALALLELGSRVTVQDSLLPGSGGDLRNLGEARQPYTFYPVDARDPNGVAVCVRDQETGSETP